MGATPYKMTKLELYRFLVNLRRQEVVVTVAECGRDGWYVRIGKCWLIDFIEIVGICEAVRLRPNDHYKLASGDYLITITRMGMDETIQDLFDGAAVGRWVER